MTFDPETTKSTEFELVPPHRTAPPLLMSLVLHVVLLVLIGIFWNRIPKGTGETEDRPVGIALVHRMPDRSRYVDQAEVAEIERANQPEAMDSSSSSAEPPADVPQPLDLAGILKAIESESRPTAGSGLAGETKLGSDAFTDRTPGGSNSDGAETTTTVFGISGSGSRFVYVFDRSDSMNGFGGAPLRQAKSELIRSLRTLTERQEFQVVFYNDKPTPFRLGSLPVQMVRAEPSYLQHAESYVRSIAAFGGTAHEDALRLALRMGPDVIFFLTDARIPRLSSKQLREIKNRADSAGATIHAIEIGAETTAPENSFLRELAAMNRGEYRYIDARRLRAKGAP